MVGREAFRLLRRHVGRRTEDQAGLRGHHAQRRRVGGAAGRRLVLDRLGETEVEHLDLTVGRDLDVRRLQVPVHYAFLVRRLERFGDLDGDRQRFFDRHRAAAQPLGQRLPFHQLHHQEVTAVGMLESEQGCDAVVVKRREHLRFAFEAADALLVRGELVEDHFDGNGASEFRVPRPIDRAHSAFAERPRIS